MLDFNKEIFMSDRVIEGGLERHFELLVSTISGAREFAAPARLASIGRRAR